MTTGPTPVHGSTESSTAAEDIGVLGALFSSRIVEDFQDAPLFAQTRLLAFLRNLPTLDDAALRRTTESAIYDSALMGGFRGNQNEHHVKADACYEESLVRQQTAGHHSNCNDSVYQRAFARVMRDQGHSATTPVCSCESLRASGISDSLAGKMPRSPRPQA